MSSCRRRKPSSGSREFSDDKEATKPATVVVEVKDGHHVESEVTETVVVAKQLYGPGHRLVVPADVAEGWVAAGDVVVVDAPPPPPEEPPLTSTLADEAWAVVDAKAAARTAARKRATKA